MVVGLIPMIGRDEELELLPRPPGAGKAGPEGGLSCSRASPASASRD